jgi:hypothetical protein
MTRQILMFALILAPLRALAEPVVVVGENIWEDPYGCRRHSSTCFQLGWPTEFGFRTAFDAARQVGSTTAIFGYDGQSILQAVVSTLDVGTDYYLVQPGQAFERDSIQAGRFPIIFRSLPSPPVSNLPMTVGGGDVYIGMALGYPNRDSFGWVHLRPDKNGWLTMVGNAIAYHAPGIIVGTATVVPEPGTWLLALAGLWHVVAASYLRLHHRNFPAAEG